MEDNNAIVVQRDATTCAPLVGEPKSLISKGGKNVLDYNQEPPPELDNGEVCRGLLRRFVHKITNNNEISPHNDMIIKPQRTYFLIPLISQTSNTGTDAKRSFH